MFYGGRAASNRVALGAVWWFPKKEWGGNIAFWGGKRDRVGGL